LRVYLGVAADSAYCETERSLQAPKQWFYHHASTARRETGKSNRHVMRRRDKLPGEAHQYLNIILYVHGCKHGRVSGRRWAVQTRRRRQ
jgi:hypothetical protein